MTYEIQVWIMRKVVLELTFEYMASLQVILLFCAERYVETYLALILKTCEEIK